MSALTPEAIEALERAALERGDLRVLMTRTQLQVDHRIRELSANGSSFVFVVYCSRRWGKTIFDAISVFEKALSTPKAIIRYTAPTKEQGRKTVIPAMEWVASKLPERSRPRWVYQDNIWIWPNGAKCYLGSAETMADAESQVGTECHLAIVDEAGKIRSSVLKHLIRSVLMPQFLTTGGYMLVTTTPAISPAHYMTELMTEADLGGMSAKYTIDDCDHVTKEARDELIERLGGIEKSEVQRELYIINDVDDTRAIIPEFKKVRHEIVCETPQPKYRDWYVVADFGFVDMSFAVFCWFDFSRDVLVVEDEAVGHHENGLEFGRRVKAKEAELGIQAPKRFADGDLQLLASIAGDSPGPGIAFGPIQKLDAEVGTNALRMRIGRKQVEINPRCVELVKHLHYGIWNQNKTDWERTDGYGHFDGIAALKYAVRVVDWNRNPEPILRDGVRPSTHHIAMTPQQLHARQQMRKILGR